MVHGSRKGVVMNRDQFWLTDSQFSKTELHLPTDTRGKPRVDDRRVISVIVHVLRSSRPRSTGNRRTAFPLCARNAIERMFCRLKDFRRLATTSIPPTA